jgi:superfamily II DNA helicase RecQ
MTTITSSQSNTNTNTTATATAMRMNSNDDSMPNEVQNASTSVTPAMEMSMVRARSLKTSSSSSSGVTQTLDIRMFTKNKAEDRADSAYDQQEEAIDMTDITTLDQANNKHVHGLSFPSHAQAQAKMKDTVKRTTPGVTTSLNTNSGDSDCDYLWNKSQEILQTTFHVQALRNLQPQAVRHALDQKSCIIVMATGAGKSLCYQLPAATLPGLTLVISPLIALMTDQVMALNQKGIRAALLSSSNTTAENNAVMAHLHAMASPPQPQPQPPGTATTTATATATHAPPLKLLYCTPELIATDRFRSTLKSIHNNSNNRNNNRNNAKTLSLFAFDEAHCLSTWGHDFRPAYRKLSWLCETFPKVPVMACTATATPKVIQDIRACLRMTCETTYPCLKGTFNRPNITYVIKYKDTLDAMSNMNMNIKGVTASAGAGKYGPAATTTNAKGGFQSAALLQKSQSKVTAGSRSVPVPSSSQSKLSSKNAPRKNAASFGGGSLGDMLSVIHEQHSKAIARKEPCSGIIYVHKRTDTKHLALQITRQTGVKAKPYHAGLKDEVRKQTQADWTSGKVPIAVATVAFGMGIDLAHVRYVIHWALAKSVEGFYQESGRAGRDGKPSLSVLYYSKDDAAKFTYLIRKQQEGKQQRKQQPQPPPTKKNGEIIKGQVVDERSFDALQQMIEYCTRAGCRRQFLLHHFGDNIVPARTCRKTCDFCQNPKRVEAAIQASSVMKQAAASASSYRGRNNNKGVKTAEWNGQWSGPQGDNGDSDNDNDFSARGAMAEWDDQDDSSGLGIYKNFSEYDGLDESSQSGGMKKARNVLDKYEVRQAIWYCNDL